MDGPKDIWHFAHPLLAKQYLGKFDLGLISARALFAKRRMGKSTFLDQDLISADLITDMGPWSILYVG
jgi:hypothetical protein